MVTETVTESFPYELPLKEGIAAIVAESVGNPEAFRHLGVLLQSTFAFVEKTNADVAAKQPPPKPLACREGCSFCCLGVEVHVSPLEAIGIAEHLATTLDGDALQALLESVLAVQEAKENMAAKGEVANFACPLLTDNVCSIYPVRPFTCRGFTSFDVTRCAARKTGATPTALIEGYVHPRRIAQCVHEGLQIGFARAELDGHPLDLTPALLMVLTTPDIREQWLAGEAVFTPAYAHHFNELT